MYHLSLFVSVNLEFIKHMQIKDFMLHFESVNVDSKTFDQWGKGWNHKKGVSIVKYLLSLWILMGEFVHVYDKPSHSS
jgi:hypothetical protein